MEVYCIQFGSKIKIILVNKININKHVMKFLTVILYSMISMDFFCSRIQFYVLLSPYLCFISFLYLDLYVLGDNVWIR